MATHDLPFVPPDEDESYVLEWLGSQPNPKVTYPSRPPCSTNFVSIKPRPGALADAIASRDEQQRLADRDASIRNLRDDFDNLPDADETGIVPRP